MNKTAVAIAPRHAAAELAQPFPPLILARLPYLRVLAMTDPSDPRQKRRLLPVRQLAMALPAGSSLRPRRARRTPRLRAPSLLSRPGQGSALVQALMILSVAVIAALALTSRLLAARGGSFSRSDSLAAREAAEYGLNQIHGQLNTNEFGFLWVTKQEKWISVTSTDLSTCSLASFNSSGQRKTTLSLPTQVQGEQTIRNSNGVKVTYQLTSYTAPSLPDSDQTTINQVKFCGSSGGTAAGNFGNLNGGSAVIIVEGKVDRGGKTSTFRLKRSTHVVPPQGIKDANYSFIILGNANTNQAGTTFGNASDIARLNYLDGNICEGTLNTIVSQKTCILAGSKMSTISCTDLESCLTNNIDTVPAKTRTKYCSKISQRTRIGLTCNDNFQQIDANQLPAITTPGDVLLKDIGTGTTTTAFNPTLHWSSYARRYACTIKTSGVTTCDTTNTSGGNSTNNQDYYFPYAKTVTTDNLPPAYNPISATSNLTSNLKNSGLAPGCFFGGTSVDRQNGDRSSTINCLIDGLSISRSSGSGIPSRMQIYSGTGTSGDLPAVNLFLYGTSTINLTDGGIANADTRPSGWANLRLLGKPSPPNTITDPVSCAASSSIVSDSNNSIQSDLNNLWLWLPNAKLTYTSLKSNERTFFLAWVCAISAPSSGVGNGNNYTIYTPSFDAIKTAFNLNSSSSSYKRSSGVSYRAYGAEDSTV